MTGEAGSRLIPCHIQQGVYLRSSMIRRLFWLVLLTVSTIFLATQLQSKIYDYYG